MACVHLERFKLPNSASSRAVYKDECTRCFDSAFDDYGIDVCLTCFNGSCKDHSQLHQRLTGHELVANVKKRWIVQQPSDSPPRKIAKVSITADQVSSNEESESTVWVKCLPCGQTFADNDVVRAIADFIKNVSSSAVKSQTKAWEAEVIPCEHTLCLEQTHSSMAIDKCRDCGLKNNLWLCLTCGNVGCGRKNYDGSGGNNHGVEHYHSTKHPVSCKLGTITAEGTADLYCYTCDDMKIDPDLEKHLSVFGIHTHQQQKTEKSMAELELEQNLKFDFSMTSDDGRSLQPVFGPGLTGLKNIGNTCYMASVLQSLFAQHSFAETVRSTVADKTETVENPAQSLACQLKKLCDGLLSGKYSRPSDKPEVVPVVPQPEAAVTDQQPAAQEITERFQAGIPPQMFKDLISKDHAEFSTARQQDAYEFMQYMLSEFDRQLSSALSDLFKFTMVYRLQCSGCKKVRYVREPSFGVEMPVRKVVKGKDNEQGTELFEEVSLGESLLSIGGGAEAVEGFKCPACNGQLTTAIKTASFGSFPRILVARAQRFILDNWVPRKLNIPIRVDSEQHSLKQRFSAGVLRPGEESMPEEETETSTPTVDESHLDQIMSMGFSRNRSMRALLATNNQGPEAAMEWLFARMDDPALDAPIESTSKKSTQEPSQDHIQMISDMGFSAKQARKALMSCNQNVEQAVEWLFSNPDDTGELDEEINQSKVAGGKITDLGTDNPEFRLFAVVAHKGTSVNCGHYVAYVRRGDKWYLFNDEKVVTIGPKLPNSINDHAAGTEGVSMGYIYMFERRD